MEPTPQNIILLINLLTQSLSPHPSIRQPAEKQLQAAEKDDGFLILLIAVIRGEGEGGGGSGGGGMDVRQAAGVLFKNVVKRRWRDDDIPPQIRSQIHSLLIPLMVSLSTPALSRLQAQVGEAVAEVGGVDFPERWEGLIDELVNSLSGDNFVINNGVLAAAHSIFGAWRSQFRTDTLFQTINLVLKKFCGPFFELFKRVDHLLSLPPTTQLPPNCSLPDLATSLNLLLQLYYDLNAQDLPEFFEDNMVVFMGDVTKPDTKEGLGLLGKYLKWSRDELMGEEEDDVPGPIQQIRATICEIAELYALKYSDEFPQMGIFVRQIWEMLGTVGMGTRDDQLVSKALGFLSVVVKMNSNSELFSAPETLKAFCERIILPNITMRTHEEEMFEDDPIEYIRQDLEPSTENDTRRAAATEFTRALLQHFEGPVTQLIGGHISSFLATYKANPSENWKAKDTAIFLLTSIASKGSTIHTGVTSTNALVDIVQFFSENVFADLQAPADSVHPILQVDAIKYLYTFRNQLTKEQLVSVLPVLVAHLQSSNYVIYSYAAITIERILFIKQNGQLLFNHTDVQPFAESILMACFANIETATTPEKMAENDYLMKCVMRVIITARQTLAPHSQAILGKLVAIIGETSKNPSNPRFNQYTFESISALIRFVSAGNPSVVEQFEQSVFPPLEYMLSNEVTEFMPYAFQIISQMLELHPVNELPASYERMMVPLLHSSMWEQRGNVPALVRLWKAMLVRGAGMVVEKGHLQGLLGIFQRLLVVKSTDVYAFDLLQSIYQCIPVSILEPFTRTVLMLILNRLQANKTPQVSHAFAMFVLFICAIKQVGPDFFVSQLQAIQPGLAAQILENVILPETQKAHAKDRKIVIVGLTKLLTQSDALLQPPASVVWPQVLEAALDVIVLPQEVRGAADEDLVEFDPEESSFQSSFSKLGASETKVEDPVPEVSDPQRFLSKELAAKSASRPGVLPPLMSLVPTKVAAPFAQYMASNSDVIV